MSDAAMQNNGDLAMRDSEMIETDLDAVLAADAPVDGTGAGGAAGGSSGAAQGDGSGTAGGIEGAGDRNTAGANGINFESRIPVKKDVTLREFLSKMDDYAPIVSGPLFSLSFFFSVSVYGFCLMSVPSTVQANLSFYIASKDLPRNSLCLINRATDSNLQLDS